MPAAAAHELEDAPLRARFPDAGGVDGLDPEDMPAATQSLEAHGRRAAPPAAAVDPADEVGAGLAGRVSEAEDGAALARLERRPEGDAGRRDDVGDSTVGGRRRGGGARRRPRAAAAPGGTAAVPGPAGAGAAAFFAPAFFFAGRRRRRRGGFPAYRGSGWSRPRCRRGCRSRWPGRSSFPRRRRPGSRRRSVRPPSPSSPRRPCSSVRCRA